MEYLRPVVFCRVRIRGRRQNPNGADYIGLLLKQPLNDTSERLFSSYRRRAIPSSAATAWLILVIITSYNFIVAITAHILPFGGLCINIYTADSSAHDSTGRATELAGVGFNFNFFVIEKSIGRERDRREEEEEEEREREEAQ